MQLASLTRIHKYISHIMHGIYYFKVN